MSRAASHQEDVTHAASTEPASPRPAEIRADQTRVFPRFLDYSYLNIERGEGARLYRTDGELILDGCSGGAMVGFLGHGVREVINAAAEQARRLPYVYNHHFSNAPQEAFAARLLEVAMPEMARVRFVSGGSEANEMALRLCRSYHVERGDTDRWRIISPAQAYHGATLGTLALTGRDSLKGPYRDYIPQHLHISPATRRSDTTGEKALDELDRVLETAAPSTVAAFFCEPVSAAAFPAYTPPDGFWEGLAERRDAHGFLIVLDEVVSGMGRTGTWFAGQQLPFEPDIVTTGKGLGCGYAPLGAVMCRDHVFAAISRGSRGFELGHTWDGAPLPCAVGLAVLEELVRRDLVAYVRERGPGLREELEQALSGSALVGEVRGRGFLLGIEFVDPRDGVSAPPANLNVAELVDETALAAGLLVISTHATPDGLTGDHTVLAPAFTASDAELGEMVERLRRTIIEVERRLAPAFADGGPDPGPDAG